MFFKRIEMHGFKSFAEPVVVEFDKGITCVVGPNGSGKSNISDAIRWVLGEQSPKMLRGGKMEDVIFSGTQSRKSRGMAEVTLVIDNQEGTLPIEYSEVAITRRMYRSGESEYAINNNQCRMRDIRDLLADTGIGVDGYSLIGQGKISEIISNKKESIREVFEESAGIVSYRNKKSEAERKLEQTNINLDRACDIISEIEGRIDSLKEDSDKAKEYLKLKDRYKALEVSLITGGLEDLQEKIVVLSDDSKNLSTNLDNFAKEKQDVEINIDVSKEKLEVLKEEFKTCADRLTTLTEELGAKNNENSIGRERLRAIENNKLRVKREISELSNKIDDERLSRDEKEKNSSDFINSLKEKAEELKLKEKESADMKQELEEASHRLREKENRLFEISREQAVLNNIKSNLNNILINLDTSMEGGEEAGTKEVEIRVLLDEKAKQEQSLNSLKEDMSKLQISLEDLEKSTKENIDSKAKKEKEVFQLGLSIGKLEARQKTLIEMEESYQGYQNAVKFIMSQNISGVEGVVADLIKVDKGLEVAIETALGAAIQNIVVNDEETGKKAIKALKDSSAGRATFLPLNKITSNRKRNTIEAKGVLGYADELVSCDEKYLDITGFLLGNTLVVDTLENAVSLSKKEKVKLVTLEGDVIFSTGAMSGGSQKHKAGNILQRKQEIDSLVEEIDVLNSKIHSIEQEISDLSKETASLSKKREEFKVSLNNKALEERVLHEENIKINNKIKSLQLEIDRNKLAVDSRKKDKEKAEQDLKLNKDLIDSLEKELEILNSSIANEENDITKRREMLALKDEELLSFKLDLAKESESAEGLKNILKMMNDNIDSMKKDIKFKEDQLLNLDADIQAINVGIEKRSKDIAEVTIERDLSIRKNKEIEVEVEKLTKQYDEAMILREEVSSKLTMIQGQKYDIDIKLARAEAQEKALRDRLWEELELSYAEAMAMPRLDMSHSAVTRENREIKNKIKNLGDINIGAIKEYEEVKTRYEFLTVEREDIQASVDQLKGIILNMDREIRKKFKESFDSIALNFENIFKEFFGGGHGKIEIDNIDDPLNATIEITAQPPGKQLKNINLLSGGEKTMTAIALMFAVLKTKPTPCCILDEVEAALDDNNIHIFANYLKQFTDVQFTLITHQKATMEHANVMYGITMPERGVSKIFSLKMGDELPV